MFSSIRSYPKKGGKGTKTSKLKKGLEKEQIPDELRNSNFDKSRNDNLIYKFDIKISLFLIIN